MEDPEKFFQTICRVCLSYGNSENMVSLTDNSTEDGLSVYGKSVYIFTNISMKDDSLPDKMCPKCLYLLKQAIIFRKTCESSNEKLIEFSRKIDKCDSEFKQKLSEYVMFVDHFPREHKKKTHKIHKIQPVLKFKGKKVTKTEKIKNESFEPLPFANDDNMDIEDLFEYNNTDGKATSATEISAGDEDIDAILTNMELLADLKPHDLENYRKRYPTKKIRGSCSKPIQIKKRKRKIHNGTAENIDVSSTEQKSCKSQKDLQCTVCSKILANHNSLLVHMQRHSGGQYICEHCGRIFATKAELKYHLAYSHDIGRQYVCKECGYKAPKMYELMEHERIHTGERPYTCDKCGLTFRRRYIWKKHALYHMEKTVPCQLCPRKFHHNGELVAHINSIHERLYIYTCNHCDITYAKTSTVRRHMTEKHGVPREMQGKIKRIKLGNTSIRTEKTRKIVEQPT